MRFLDWSLSMTRREVVRVRDVAQVVGGATPKTAEPTFWGGAIPWLTPKDLSDRPSRYTTQGTRFLTDRGLSSSSARLLPPGSVLLTSRAPIGLVTIANAPIATNQGFKSLVLDETQCPEYWYYLLASSGDYLRSVANGSTFLEISGKVVGDLEFEVPPLDEQRRIAEVLGALDDLIDTNESNRESLVALVKAEFDRRFKFRPLGPTVGELAKVVDCLHSKKPEQLAEGRRLLLQLNNIRDDGLMDLQSRYLISDQDYALWSKNLETEPHDLVVTNVGRVGAVARVPIGLTAALGRNMTAVRADDPAGDAAFMTVALLSPAVRREIENKTDSGTILNALNVRSIPKLRLQDSTPGERRSYSEWALPLLEMCDSLIAHNAQLRRTRDELLPLLMSGAVRVRPEGVAA